MPKALKSDARNVILQVAPIISLDKLCDRVAAATGVGERFVRKLVKEKEQADETGTKISTPGKKRKMTKGKIEVDNFDLGVSRRKIHEFYACAKKFPH
ncbi:unnamed protein product [Leptidea sinapis]|uniref:Uncharacterized protein n=1 Tax=Leptidea sinapis TaxID=189913 RepID=A0A5E4QXZ0_9NEOP|nr:unnamed protein product [Leptidea sinapis]